MILFIVTKLTDFDSDFIGVFSTFDKAKAQVNIKCNKYGIDNTLIKLRTGIWTTDPTNSLFYRIEKVILDKKEDL